MQAFIKDNRLIVNSMIFKDDKAKLLNYIEQMENKDIIPEKLYDVEGNISGIAFSIKEA